MKRLFTLFAFLITLSFCANAQVTLDRVSIKFDSLGFDSARIEYTSRLGQPNLIQSLIFNNSGCITHISQMTFRDSLLSPPITFDTTVRIGYFGLITHYYSLEAAWVTGPLFPPPPRIIMDSFLYDVCSVTGIKEKYKDLELNFYPNPSNNLITFKSTLPIYINKLQLYDVQGRLIEVASLQNRVYQCDHLEAGIYFIRLTDQKNNPYSHLQKLIITD